MKALATALLACCALGAAHSATPARPLGPSVKHYDFHVALAMAAPDCFEKQVVTVNGELNPTISVTRGDILEVTVFNELPEDWPAVTDGITVHWHGFSMQGAEWYDGVAYMQQCPIHVGQNFTYRFQVNETPGTYWYHGHAGVERVDGLYGPLIVMPRGPEPFAYDEDKVLIIADNYHGQANPMAMPLNRPFDQGKQTNDSGGWIWVDLPQSILLNNHGFYGDCAMGPAGNAAPITCNITTQFVPPGRSSLNAMAAPTNPGCQRANITVSPGKTYRLRIINAGSLTYQTLCFEGHNVTLVAADAVPTQPLSVPCVDINLGQRMDVLLRADRPVSNYWFTSQTQYRPGSPSGYGVLQYEGANASALPSGKLPQPGTIKPWSIAQTEQVRMLHNLTRLVADPNLAVFPANSTSLAVPDATHTVFVNMTQPLLSSGQLRWALNNVASYKTPTCNPALREARDDASWLGRHAQLTAANPVDYDMIQQGNASQPELYLYEHSPVQLSPVAGQYFVEVAYGDVIDVVLQNMAANANGGDYRPVVGKNRTAQEQHPFHMHGHHFWVLGHGLEMYDNTANASSLNVLDPPYRDSFTIFKGGWTVIRFVADNPGIWLLHCHTDWHLYMGQKMFFAESVDRVGPPPRDAPACPATCPYNFAAWRPKDVAEHWGTTGYAI